MARSYHPGGRGAGYRTCGHRLPAPRFAGLPPGPAYQGLGEFGHRSIPPTKGQANEMNSLIHIHHANAVNTQRLAVRRPRRLSSRKRGI